MPRKRRGLTKVASVVRWQKEDVSVSSDDERSGKRAKVEEDVFVKTQFDRTDSGSIHIKQMLDR